MADITKCKGTDCPLKETCYRFLAMVGLIQSYFKDVPFKDGKCEYYWNIKQLSLTKQKNYGRKNWILL